MIDVDPIDPCKPKLVLSRMQCNRCQAQVASTYRHDYVTCGCGYLSLDGGRAYQRMIVEDKQGVEPYRDFVDLSIWTRPYSRRGLIVQAYRPVDINIYCTNFDGRTSVAEAPNDFVVYEAEGGSTAWKPDEFHATHIPMEK